MKNSEHSQELIRFVQSSYGIDVDSNLWNEVDFTLNELIKLEGKGKAGVQIALEILKNVEGSSADLDLLVTLADKITRLDDEINLMGLTQPEIKPITDMFNKRKENIDGNNLKVMARTTLDCYKNLILECQYMMWLAGEFQRD